MAAPSTVAVATARQWRACRHVDTVFEPGERVVVLRWDAVATPPASPGGLPVAGPAGLAVDRACFVYHAVPEEGRVARVRWRDGAVVTDAQDVLSPPAPPDLGPFRPVAGLPADAVRGVAMAVDHDNRLFVVDATDGAVAVYDLADRRLVQRARFPAPALDVASAGDAVLVLCDDPDRPLWRLAARREPKALPLPASVAVPSGRRLLRIATGLSGQRWGLAVDAAGGGLPVSLDAGGPTFDEPVPDATDIEVDGEGAVVVADATGAELRRYSAALDVGDPSMRPLVARGYDGRGIVRMPDGSIGFWTAGGVRRAVAAMLRFAARGTVDAEALDAGDYGATWGRVFVDACVPEGASVWVATATTDDEDAPPSEADLADVRRMHCRETGPDAPWLRPSDDDPYETLEAVADGGPGRYLWVRLELRGTIKATPKVRALRVEHPAHGLLRRMPGAYRRDPETAEFLHRYLGIAHSLLADVERRAEERHVLLDPAATPMEVLPWVASLVGLTLDQRWPEAAQRRMVAEAVCLFATRGTKGGLERMLEICLDGVVGHRPVVVELFRVRGQGGGVLGDEGAAWSNAVVGGGLRVGGAAGDATARPLEGTTTDAFTRTAHRFSVVIPGVLDEQQERMVRDLLDEHKPAHTAYELCTVDAGMRVGKGLYVELTSIVGPTSGFEQVRVGDSAVGQDAVLGRPRAGIRPGASRLGRTTRVGE